MKNNISVFTWSTGWWLEDNQAWFVSGTHNMLFSVDLETGKCEKISTIPGIRGSSYLLNPFCIKCDRDIFCISGYGNNIWIYNLEDNTFMGLDIDKPEDQYLASQFWRIDDTLYIVGGVWNKIIEVSISQRAITNYYVLCENDSIMRSVLVGNQIYAVSAKFGRIYQFDVVTKKVKTNVLPDFQKGLFTICHDGEKFWISGYQKELYIWDEKENSLTILDCFPDNFDTGYTAGSYIPQVFERSVVVGDTIWFMPTRRGKILYANKKTHKISVFEIYDEDEMSILSNKPYEMADFLLEYVRADRYIGVYSAKCRRIFEIDTRQLRYQWMEYYFSDKSLEQCREDFKGIFHEGEHDPFYIQFCNRGIRTIDHKENDADTDSVGMKIYTRITMEDM